MRRRDGGPDVDPVAGDGAGPSSRTQMSGCHSPGRPRSGTSRRGRARSSSADRPTWRAPRRATLPQPRRSTGGDEGRSSSRFRSSLRSRPPDRGRRSSSPPRRRGRPVSPRPPAAGPAGRRFREPPDDLPSLPSLPPLPSLPAFWPRPAAGRAPLSPALLAGPAARAARAAPRPFVPGWRLSSFSRPVRGRSPRPPAGARFGPGLEADPALPTKPPLGRLRGGGRPAGGEGVIR